MLQLTPEETAFVAEFEADSQRINAEIAAFRDLPRLSFQATEAERAERTAEEKRVTALRDAHNARQKDRVAVRVGLKNEFNTFIASKIPGGEAGALIDVASEILAALATDETSVGTARLLKSVVVLGIDSFNDADVHAARARGTFARYTALTDAGFSSDQAFQLILASASRSFSVPNFSLNKR